MNPQREIELKLEVEPRAAASVGSDIGLGKGRAMRLLATYYDTPEGSLRKRGISFRVRRNGDAYVQTIKVARGTASGLFDREEWETPLAGERPDLSAIDAAGLRDSLADPSEWNALRPIFTVDVERTNWRTNLENGSAEVVLDLGSVLADGAEDTVAELEIELTDGPPDLLFGLARRVADAVPVRLGVLTKSERGYRLLDGKAGRPTKAEPLRLPPDATTAEAFATIVQACLRHYRLNEPLVARRDADALHQARVALRRLRSAFSLFRDVVADERFEDLSNAVRRQTGLLGDARNLDILLHRLGSAPEAGPAFRHLQSEREAAYDHVLEELDSDRARRLPLDLLEWAEIGAWRSTTKPDATLPAREFAGQVLDRYRRRVTKRGKGLRHLDPEKRHKVRIEAKKLRYASEFFTSLFDGKKQTRRAKTFLSALEDLQTALGELNDIATGEALTRELSAKGIDLPVAAGGKGERKLLREADAAYDRLVDAKRFWR